MKAFLSAARVMLLDLASTFCFVIALALTDNTVLAVCVGMAVGVIQIALQLLRRKPIEAMEWLSLFLVVAAGATTLLTDDPTFILLKPSVIYVIIGIVMCRPGWMNRYLPAIARTYAGDTAIVVGFIWAGLMFVSAVVNAVVALNWSATTWAMVMGVYGIASKAILFVAGFAAIRLTARRRIRALPEAERAALLNPA